MSSLLMLGLYFKFGRFWSVRNLDLVLLILLAPGLLMAQYGGEASVKARRLMALENQKRETNGPAAAPVEPPIRREIPKSFEPKVTPDVDPSPPTEPAAPEADSAASGEDSAASGEDSAASGGEEATVEEPSPPKTSADMLLASSRKIERLGYLWLFAVGALLLLRLLLDPTMVRRPLLEPNLTSGGLTFIGVSLFVFLMANVWNSEPLALERLDEIALSQSGEPEVRVQNTGSLRRGPGYPLLNLVPSIPTNPLVPEGAGAFEPGKRLVVAKLIAILCHLAVVLGIVAVGYWHFGSIKTGIGMTTLYLMLPYTAQMTGHIEHVIPAGLLVWAVLCYRRPLTSGMFIGLATSLVYYPLFLLPLWISFYWRKGLMRFLIGVVATLVVMAILLYFIPEASYWKNLQKMFGLWFPYQEGLEGIWRLGWEPVYRIPVLAAFVAMAGTLAIWPAQKNLGTLLSCSAAVMVATQFWHGFGGGLYIGWYLPLLLLTIFRPNLEDRIALAVLGEGWNPRRVVGAANGLKDN
ncbi:MAG: hypothetical protein KJ000_09665 [Pirellulaceae bacterium]|nr:hypothetical protein [Pirellulaceae bacterium]